MWEFPHAELRPRESAESGARRVAAELTGVEAVLGRELLTIRHGVTRFRITLRCFEATHRAGTFASPFYRAGLWLTPRQLANYPVSAAPAPAGRAFAGACKTIAMLTVANILDFLDDFAPPRLAAEWDNVGLLLGDRSAAVARVMTCLTVTPRSAAEAVQTGAQLIVTHHPMLFRAVKRLTDATPEGRILLSLARAGVAVYSPHSALDNAAGGINETLARALGLTRLGPLRRRDEPRSCKVVVFVPDQDLRQVSDWRSLPPAPAASGNTASAASASPAPAPSSAPRPSQPSVGEKGRREEVSEWRLEVVCPEPAVAAVVAAMRRVHSYEEPAFDVYSLQPAASPLGEGRVGDLERPVPLGEAARQARTMLRAGAVQLVGDRERAVQRVAVACGAAGEFLGDAARARADVFLTGEMRFHDYLDARVRGVALLLPGHYATERFGVEDLAERLARQWPESTVWASREESDPVTWE